MADIMTIYLCEICGNVIEILRAGAGQLVCCGQPMTQMDEKTEDSKNEKHVPYILRENGAYVVRVGENVLHPMEERHHIEWIELIVDGRIYRRHLKPGDKPEAIFEIPEGKDVRAREMCNIHGLWVNRKV